MHYLLCFLLDFLRWRLFLELSMRFHAALFALLWLLLVTLVPSLSNLAALSILAPLVIYGVVASIVPQLRHSVGWIHKGCINSGVIKLIAATVFVSALALIGWVILTKPDIEHHLALVPEMPFWAYPIAWYWFRYFQCSNGRSYISRHSYGSAR